MYIKFTLEGLNRGAFLVLLGEKMVRIKETSKIHKVCGKYVVWIKNPSGFSSFFCEHCYRYVPRSEVI